MTRSESIGDRRIAIDTGADQWNTIDRVDLRGRLDLGRTRDRRRRSDESALDITITITIIVTTALVGNAL